ncbi:DUF4258 domain-containing protein [Desulfoferrobacter suflitae]|uniref:DUF4258 domain-containing protein n=1 Tax=Desulfoferrobacter suflitae TaxID=2865782 RepID=UPI00338DB7CC
MREKIRTRQYVMTVHAEEEMDEDGLSIFDVERCILTGEIIARQKDRREPPGSSRVGATMTLWRRPGRLILCPSLHLSIKCQINPPPLQIVQHNQKITCSLLFDTTARELAACGESQEVSLSRERWKGGIFKPMANNKVLPIRCCEEKRCN